MRAVVIVSLALLVAWNAAFLVPIAATLGFLYAIYFAVRVAVLGGLNPAPCDSSCFARRTARSGAARLRRALCITP
jgi:hypothetical protein